jgi:molybdenum cofactor cytidylyltransferase
VGTTAAVVLAAGDGSRYRVSGGKGHKLLAPLRGRTVVDWAVAHALEAGLDATYLVTGAVDLPVPPEVVAVPNPQWVGGIATSLQAALAAARHAGHDAVVVGLGDQPLVSPEAWRRLGTSPAPIAVATYQGVRGNPVRLAASVWPDLPMSGDEGARALMRSRPELVTEVPCPGDPSDLDEVDDLPHLRHPGWNGP